MDMMRPPTDNLYKFIAISGLIIMLASWFFPLQEAWERHREAVRIRAQIDAVEREMELLHPGRERLDRISRKYQSIGDTASDSTLQAWGADTDTIVSGWPDTRGERYSQYLERFRKVFADNAELVVTTEHTNSLVRVGAFFFVIGLVATVSGFVLWYIKVQRYEDKILKARAGSE